MEANRAREFGSHPKLLPTRQNPIIMQSCKKRGGEGYLRSVRLLFDLAGEKVERACDWARGRGTEGRDYRV